MFNDIYQDNKGSSYDATDTVNKHLEADDYYVRMWLGKFYYIVNEPVKVALLPKLCCYEGNLQIFFFFSSLFFPHLHIFSLNLNFSERKDERTLSEAERRCVSVKHLADAVRRFSNLVPNDYAVFTLARSLDKKLIR